MNEFIEELDRLVQLQRIDSLLEEAARAEKEYPSKIKEIQARFEREQQKTEKDKGKLDTLQKRRREQEKELELELEKIKKSQERLLMVKTNEEYHAVLREIDHARSQNSKIEEEILRMMEEIEETTSQMDKREIQLKEEERICQEEKLGLEKRLYDYQKEVVNQSRGRDELLTKIDSALVRQYETIKEKRYGLAVVPVRNGCCSGCNKTIPHQVLNEVLTGDRLMTCPLCSRILYWEKGNATSNS